MNKLQQQKTPYFMQNFTNNLLFQAHYIYKITGKTPKAFSLFTCIISHPVLLMEFPLVDKHARIVHCGRRLKCCATCKETMWSVYLEPLRFAGAGGIGSISFRNYCERGGKFDLKSSYVTKLNLGLESLRQTNPSSHLMRNIRFLIKQRKCQFSCEFILIPGTLLLDHL